MKAIFFDLDGTLCNTLGDIRYHVNKMLASRGYPEISEEQTKAFVGDGAKKLVERALPAGAADAEECYALFLDGFSHSDGALLSLYEGEREALEGWKKAGYLLAVITNKPQEATRRTLAKFFPENFFDFVGGDSGMFPVKPAMRRSRCGSPSATACSSATASRTCARRRMRARAGSPPCGATARGNSSPRRAPPNLRRAFPRSQKFCKA